MPLIYKNYGYTNTLLQCRAARRKARLAALARKPSTFEVTQNYVTDMAVSSAKYLCNAPSKVASVISTTFRLLWAKKKQEVTAAKDDEGEPATAHDKEPGNDHDDDTYPYYDTEDEMKPWGCEDYLSTLFFAEGALPF
jgi:hypothetical protein